MRTILSLCLTGAVALSIISCSCPRCHGYGTEVALTSGYHPYTKKKYKANETIPCVQCGGLGQRGVTPNASAFSDPNIGLKAMQMHHTSHSGPQYVERTEIHQTNTHVTPVWFF